MKKRIIGAFLCLVLIFSLVPVCAGATETVRTELFGGEEYDVISGTYYADTGSYSAPYQAFYYSDGFFEEEPEIYNEHLATTSMNLCEAI